MDSSARKAFNDNFSPEKYEAFLDSLNDGLKNPVPFRVAETPVFLADDFRDKLLAAGEDIIDVILQPDFKQITERAIPDKWRVANENDHPHLIALDFGVCKDQHGNIVPKLIELQGFPSLFGFQVFIGEAYQHIFNIPDEWTIYFNGLANSSYTGLLKETILGPYSPEEVVVMDVNAPQQKTAIDFYCTEELIGTPIVSLSDLKQDGNRLFYLKDGKKQYIKRIYNRLIFDEIDNDPDIFKNNV